MKCEPHNDWSIVHMYLRVDFFFQLVDLGLGSVVLLLKFLNIAFKFFHLLLTRC